MARAREQDDPGVRAGLDGATGRGEPPGGYGAQIEDGQVGLDLGEPVQCALRVGLDADDLEPLELPEQVLEAGPEDGARLGNQDRGSLQGTPPRRKPRAS